MRDLRQADVELVLDAVRDLYALQDLPSFRARALAAVVRLVPGLRHGYVEAAPARRHYVMLIDPPDSIDAEIEAAAQRHLPEHPTFVNRARIAPGTASKISDFVSGRAFRRLGLYHEVYRPIGAEDLLGFEIPSASGADHFASFGVNRDRSGFSERDRQLLDLLSPHVAQAFTSAETVTLLLGAGTDPGAEAVVLDGRGRIDIASARARRLLADYFPPASFGELPEPLGAWVRGWGATLRNGDALARPLGPLTVGRGDRHLRVRFVPPPPHGTRALLVLAERVEPSADALRPLGLTRRQAEVLLSVTQGKTDAQIAADLVLSRRTVEKYLAQIFDRLGVRTRTAAAARAFPLLAATDDTSSSERSALP